MEPIDFHSMGKNIMKTNGYHQLFGYQHSSKYLILCLTEERVNYGGIFQLNQVFVMEPIDFHDMEKNTMKSMGTINCLVTSILQNIFFGVQQRKRLI